MGTLDVTGAQSASGTQEPQTTQEVVKPAVPAAAPATQNAPAPGGQTQTTPTAGANAGNEAGSGEKMVPQTDVDKIAGQARKEGKSAERAALLQELGVKNLDEAKVAIKATEDARLAQLSEAERMKAEIAARDAKLAELQQSTAQANAAALNAQLRAEVVSKASGRFQNAEAVLKLADLSGVKFEDGKFSGLDEALEKVAKDFPFTLTQKTEETPAKKPAPKIGASNAQTGAGKSASDEELRAKYFGGGGRRGLFEPKADGVVNGKR